MQSGSDELGPLGPDIERVEVEGRWFSWRRSKDRANRAKHHLPLSAGIPALLDRDGILTVDRSVQGAPRWIAIGRGDRAILVVVHIDMTGDGSHLISVRKANGHERERYRLGED